MIKSTYLKFLLMLTLAVAASACSPNEPGGGGNTHDDEEEVDEPSDSGDDAAPTEEEALGAPSSMSQRVGPVGSDNGTKSSCTGTGTGVRVVCVDTALGVSTGPGTAASPYKTISQAITAAKAGDTIQIAEGTYAENPVIGGFNNWSSKRLNILGGFQSGSSFAVRDQGTYRTLIDGGLTTVGLRLFVSAGSNNMVVDGLAIKRGKGLGTAWNNGYGHGGGVYVQWVGTGVLTLSHLEVFDSQTNSIAANSQQGGGLWATTTANGSSTGRVKVEDSQFYNNKGGKGAGLSGQGNIDVYRNRIEGNFGQNDHGGGFYMSVSGGAFEDNLIKDNDIGILAGYGWGGGGVFVGGSATLKRNVFTGNYAPLIGSGVFFDEQNTSTMEGDLLYKNDCTSNAGAAVYVDGAGSSGPGSTLTMTNVTVADHVCSGAAIFLERQSSVTLKNAILWGNTTDINGQSGTTWSATYSVTSLSGTGNITSDPLFVNSAGNDYHLKSTAGHYTTSGWVTDASTSPAIDAGDTASAFSNEPSPNGSRINMGAYGNTAEASKSATLDYEACPGQPYTLSLGGSQTITGNAGTSADDETSCSTTSGDRVYKFTLSQTGGIFSASVTGATLAVRTTCTSSSGELCGTSAEFEATSTIYYVIVEGSGSFTLDVDYAASVCGDGFVASTEECEPPTPYCNSQCESEAPDPAAEACPGKSFNVPSGSSTLTASANDLTTVNYVDDLAGSCSPMTGGQDYVLSLTPAISGTLTVRVGLDSNGDPLCEANTCSADCWDVVLSARSTCSNSGTELDCANDTDGGEEIVIPVTASTPVSVIVDGINGGWYAKGPFDVQLSLTP